jgi:prefoldin subunit 5
MNNIDNQITALQEQLSLLQRQQEALRLERAKSYADAFIHKLEADGIPLKVGLQAFHDLSKFTNSKLSSKA